MICVVATVISKSFMKIVLGQRRVCNFRCGKSCQQQLDRGNRPTTVPGSFILQSGDTPKRSPGQMTNGPGKIGRELEQDIDWSNPKSAAGEQPTGNMQICHARRRTTTTTAAQDDILGAVVCQLLLPDGCLSRSQFLSVFLSLSLSTLFQVSTFDYFYDRIAFYCSTARFPVCPNVGQAALLRGPRCV